MHWSPCSYIVQVTQSGQQHWPIGNDMRWGVFPLKNEKQMTPLECSHFLMLDLPHWFPGNSRHQIQKCRNCVEPISILEKPCSFFYQKWEPEIQTFSPTCSCSASPEVVLPPKLQVADMGRPAPPKDVVAETSIRSLGYIVVQVDG